MTFIQNFDWGIINFINNYLHNPLLDRLMVLFTSLGNFGLIWILIAIVLLIIPKYRRIGFMILCALAFSTIADEALKNLFQRLRPCIVNPDVQLLITKPLSYSFPSGHTASSFAAAGILIRMVNKYRSYVITLASLIAFSRIYLFVHYPTDIIGGIIVGLLCSGIVVYFFDFWSQRSIHKDENKGDISL